MKVTWVRLQTNAVNPVFQNDVRNVPSIPRMLLPSVKANCPIVFFLVLQMHVVQVLIHSSFRHVEKQAAIHRKEEVGWDAPTPETATEALLRAF